MPPKKKEQDLLRVLPNAKDIEDGVIGAILLSPNAYFKVSDFLTVEAFHNPDNNLIFSIFTNLTLRFVKIEMLSVAEELFKIGRFNRLEILPMLSSLTNKASTDIEYHANILHQKYILRELIKLSHIVEIEAYENGADSKIILEKSTTHLYNLTKGTFKKDFTSPDVNVMDALKKLDTSLARVPGTITGKESGFKKLDENTGGWQDTDLIILAARPSTGKTTLSLNFAYNYAYKVLTDLGGKGGVGFFSLEMRTHKLINRMLSAISGIDYSKITKAKMSNEERQQLGQAADLLSKVPIYIDDTAAINSLELRSKVRRMKEKHGVGLIIIDYLQLMSPVGKSTTKNKTEEVGDISKDIKAIAKDFEIPIIALSQLSRAIEARAEDQKTPRLSDLRESGCLSGETKILIPSTFENIRICDLIYRKDFHILATNSKESEIMKAKKCFSTGVKKVYELTLSNGMKIKATDNHKFFTNDGWKPMNEISNSKVSIPINYHFENEYECSEEEVRLVGHFISNGSCLKGQPIRYCANILDADLSENVSNDALVATGNKVIPNTIETRLDKNSFRVTYFKPTFHLTHGKTSPVGDIMRKYGIFDVRAKEKHIPEKMFFLSNKNTFQLLRALFSGDGCAYYREYNGRKSLNISYSSASEKLIFGIQMLLFKVGIISTVTPLSNKKNQSWFNLTIKGKDNMEMYIKNIGFINKRKNNIMLDAWERSKEIRAGWTLHELNQEKTLAFFPVKDIKYIGEETVYDIEVPILHNFTANGIIVHNSIEQDADVVMFLWMDKGETFLKIAKARDGELNTFTLNRDMSIQKFTEKGSEPFRPKPDKSSKNFDEGLPESDAEDFNFKK